MPLFLLAVIQSLLLCSGQIFLKFALQKMGCFAFTTSFFCHQLTNWWFLACGLCYLAASVLWMYIVKNFPFSMAYPMVSLSYVFGMVAAMLVFHEAIPATRWFGVALIILGCLLVAR